MDSSDTRQRAWDGHDQNYRDDLTLLRGNHFLQFGGSYQRNYDFYTRNDNGIAVDASLVYQVGYGSGIAFPTAYVPAGLPSSQLNNYENLYSEVLGIVDQPQVMCTRSGPNLTLNPIGNPTSVHAIVPSYNAYFSDSWHIRLGNGMARANDLGIGFRTNEFGALVDAYGRPSSALFTLGPPLRGELFETTAVPEIRAQAQALARRLMHNMAVGAA